MKIGAEDSNSEYRMKYLVVRSDSMQRRLRFLDCIVSTKRGRSACSRCVSVHAIPFHSPLFNLDLAGHRWRCKWDTLRQWFCLVGYFPGTAKRHGNRLVERCTLSVGSVIFRPSVMLKCDLIIFYSVCSCNAILDPFPSTRQLAP